MVIDTLQILIHPDLDFKFHSDIGSDMESSMVAWFVETTCEYYFPILSSQQLLIPTVVSVTNHPIYIYNVVYDAQYN